MSAQNRASDIGKLQNLLKKAYKPIVPVENRTLMEHLLYACLLENAPYELADEALARLEQDYFDWNEVRVTTITELAEVLQRLPDSSGAAVRLKKNLHGIFESMYSYDLEELRKMNLGKSLQKFEKLPAMTSFVMAYITQHGLGGHAIPLDSAALRFFWLCNIINEKELKSGKVTGLERAIPKNKGVEFASLLHQAAVAINIDPSDPTARAIVLALNPDLDQQISDHVAEVKKRRVAKAKAKEEAEAEADAESAAPPAKSASKSAGKSPAAGKTDSAAKDTGTGEKKNPAKPSSDKSVSKPTSAKPAGAKPAPAKSESKPAAETASAKISKPVTDKAKPASAAADAPKAKTASKKTAPAASDKNAVEKNVSDKKSTDKKATDKKATDKKAPEKPVTEKKPVDSSSEKSAEKKTASKTASKKADGDSTKSDTSAGTSAAKKSSPGTGGKKLSKRKPR